eukprot:m.11519 g.11519  ORF g.11519 m.11519 type:complete len:344 (+) comp5738_c0_seq1:144-1175(+)
MAGFEVTPVIDPKLVIDEITPHLLCAICGGVQRDAVTCPQQHQFCKQCLKSSIESTSQCPTCTLPTPWAKVTSATFARDYVGRLRMWCPNKCGDVLLVRDLATHLVVHCKAPTTPCPNNGCTDQLVETAMEAHKAVCPYRTVMCGTCNQTYTKASEPFHVCAPPQQPCACKSDIEEMQKQVAALTTLTSSLAEVLAAPTRKVNAHRHALHKTKGLKCSALKTSYLWNCDRCRDSHAQEEDRWRCFSCDFDLCSSCMKGQATLEHLDQMPQFITAQSLHKHNLRRYTNRSRPDQRGVHPSHHLQLVCDKCKTSDIGSDCYSCPLCDNDFCSNCVHQAIDCPVAE